ncbi:membrane protein required for beta-lactamase induction [Paraperlucidibaca baekdonensis]|uniref:Membrane protein required for beta-lactamase induction n=1 Tax=Paraperlucidibaca baekdonensis TaxID=748120 RepID=A0A3E0H2M2_9GAMM|nr:hypothetical protein [Paraperlucidibaca baekdonensis]REH37559.1 membrane protein required for beta-lactamase induction [Paraperlucidibaca baekdonensis]
MTLLLALMAVAAYHAMPEHWRHTLACPATRWLAWSTTLTLSDALRLAIAVLLPMVLLVVGLALLDELASVFMFLLCAVVVVAVFADSAVARVATDQRAEWTEAEWPSDDELLENALSLSRQQHLRRQLNELFAPLFWLLLATPVAALGYYLLRRSALGTSDDDNNLALNCLRLADWLPARLLAMSFALAGNFTATWGVISSQLLRAESVAYELIDHAANAAEPIAIDPSLTPAVGLATAMHQLNSLLQRALVVWMVFVALKTLWPGM